MAECNFASPKFSCTARTVAGQWYQTASGRICRGAFTYTCNPDGSANVVIKDGAGAVVVGATPAAQPMDGRTDCNCI
jgi:hypothetical protein